MVEVAEMEEEKSGAALRRVISFSDMILGFYEVGDDGGDEAAENSDHDEHGGGGEVNKAFWESQHHLLRGAMSKSSSLELRVRRETETALGKLRSDLRHCCCSRSCAAAVECRDCLLKRVSEQLRLAGYDSALCESKWRSSADIPKGEHTYIDVVEPATGRKEPDRLVIELRFRQEFEVARASAEYRRLLSRLPEVFVGKPERLRGLIKLVCAAAKQCMKENKLHMPPWRKPKYMQAKWLSPCERLPPAGLAAPSPRFFPDRHAAAAAATNTSLPLAVDFSKQMPRLHHRTPVEVV